MVLLLACNDSPGGGGGGGGTEGALGVRTFYSLNENEQPYTLTAELLAENSRCEIWVEKGAGISIATARSIANTYNTAIFPRLMNEFGTIYNFGNGNFLNTMQVADLLGDENGKLIILFLDIGFAGGYFWSGNFVNDVPGSNLSDIIFIDTSAVLEGDMQFTYEVIAHEMQHLMNFVTNVLLVSNDERSYVTELWLNESLSEYAQWVYSGKHPQGYVNWYNNDSSGEISKGDNFYMWNNRNVLNDYVTAYLFFQYLRLNNNDKDLFYNIFMSEYHNYQAITSSLPGSITWTQLLERWHTANFLNIPNTIYGYGNDTELGAIKAKYINTTAVTSQLYPGEAVYSFSSAGISAGAMPALNSAQIRYVGLGVNDVLNNVPAGRALLSFSTVTNINASFTNGTITGIVPPPPSLKMLFNADMPVQAKFQFNDGNRFRNMNTGINFTETIYSGNITTQTNLDFSGLTRDSFRRYRENVNE